MNTSGDKATRHYSGLCSPPAAAAAADAVIVTQRSVKVGHRHGRLSTTPLGSYDDRQMIAARRR